MLPSAITSAPALTMAVTIHHNPWHRSAGRAQRLVEGGECRRSLGGCGGKRGRVGGVASTTRAHAAGSGAGAASARGHALLGRLSASGADRRAIQPLRPRPRAHPAGRGLPRACRPEARSNWRIAAQSAVRQIAGLTEVERRQIVLEKIRGCCRSGRPARRARRRGRWYAPAPE